MVIVNERERAKERKSETATCLSRSNTSTQEYTSSWSFASLLQDETGLLTLLEVKVGARVMCLANLDVQNGLVNGRQYGNSRGYSCTHNVHISDRIRNSKQNKAARERESRYIYDLTVIGSTGFAGKHIINEIIPLRFCISFSAHTTFLSLIYA